MPWYVSSPETNVPKVVGLQTQEAVDLLEKEGFKPVISDTSYGLKFQLEQFFFKNLMQEKLLKRVEQFIYL